jgi:hypothetical protein
MGTGVAGRVYIGREGRRRADGRRNLCNPLLLALVSCLSPSPAGHQVLRLAARLLCDGAAAAAPAAACVLSFSSHVTFVLAGFQI